MFTRYCSAAGLLALLCSALPAEAQPVGTPLRLPYMQAGLTTRQAAACLLDRLAFGAGPGDVDLVLRTGLEAWIGEQLTAALPDSDLNERLAPMQTLTMSAGDIAATYPNPGVVLAMAYRDGAISRGDTTNKQVLRQKAIAYATGRGIRSQKDMLGEMTAQKILRAVYSRNQLREVLTDFWFNHFNVATTDNQARPFVLAYERDVIRPNVLGRFRDLLEATAKHPAMLLYLDNAQSTAPDSVPTTLSHRLETLRNLSGLRGRTLRRKIDQGMGKKREAENAVLTKFGLKRGLNENYARELMELHTLGVDGGYSQKDVVDVARAFTGWTLCPPGVRGRKLRERIARGNSGGFAVQGDFLFRADAHDAAPKILLGQAFPAGGGMDEGERVLDILARHPSTALHIVHKLAVRFVSDTPSDTLQNRLAGIFLKSDGNLRPVIRAIVESPEFWVEAGRHSKIKSPFEVAVSSLRAIGADIYATYNTNEWITRMGQPLFGCQPPTGFPDGAENWVNTGSLLNRMNFGLNLAMNQILGLDVNLPSLYNNHEPESPEAALEIYTRLLLPERDPRETLRLLAPAVQSPDFAQKVREAARAQPASSIPQKTRTNKVTGDEEMDGGEDLFDPAPSPTSRKSPRQMNPQTLSQVVGVILGSPEFQRR